MPEQNAIPTNASTPFHPVDVILHKRDGFALTTAEIDAFIRALVDPTAPGHPTDAQTSALLMAIFLRGLNPRELADLTSAMRLSGEVFDASSLGPTFLVDKHSTGGVGDKTSLLIAPILAAAGLAHPTPAGVPGICVPMISGRSLGHTGGTLDKLETIPGFNTQLALPQFLETLRTCGAALIGQTPTLVPADRILYALRDHTGTVESPNLICASIMSKKLAESLHALVLDVKTGSGAFMRSYEDARHLASLMVQTGEASGTRTVALLTSHDQPLGRFAGNWLEVQECADILRPDFLQAGILRRGPDPARRHPMSADLIELSNILAGWMLHLANHAPTPEAGTLLANDYLNDGSAYKAWLGIVKAQGGDITIFDVNAADTHPALTRTSIHTRTVTASTAGFLSSMDTREIGWAVQRLGAGRAKPGDPVSPHAGIEIHAKLGDHLSANQPLITLYAEEESLLAEPCEMLRATLKIASTPPNLNALVREVIQQ